MARQPRRFVTPFAGEIGRAVLRVAIIGAGLMGRWHAYYARHCGAEVCAIADVDTDAARKLARTYGAPVFSDLERLLVKIRPDVLHICTPLGTHADLVEVALEAGLHTLVEKPFTESAGAAERLLRRGSERGLHITPVHQFVFQDGVLWAASALSRIGRPLHLDATFCSAGGSHLPEPMLNAVILDILTHPLSLIECFRPGEMVAGRWNVLGSSPGECRVTGELGTTTASVLVSLGGRPTECSFRITGSKGSIRLDLFHGFGFYKPGDVSRNRKIAHPFDLGVRRLTAASCNLVRRALRREPAYPGLCRLVRLFYRAVGGAQAPVSATEVMAVAHMRDRVAESLRASVAVQVNHSRAGSP